MIESVGVVDLLCCRFDYNFRVFFRWMVELIDYIALSTDDERM